MATDRSIITDKLGQLQVANAELAAENLKLNSHLQLQAAKITRLNGMVVQLQQDHPAESGCDP